MNKNIKNIIFKFFHFCLSFIEYQDIIDNKFIINGNNKDILLINENTLYINLENNLIYNKSIFEYLSKLFNNNNIIRTNKIYKLIIVYEYDNINIINNKKYFIDNLENINQKKCFLPNLNEIIINNITNKICHKNLINPSKIFDIITFLCFNSYSLSSIILNDTYLPYNILDIFNNDNIFINKIKNIKINSSSLNAYNYSTIIERINKCINLEYISINTMSSNFNDSFGNIKISKNLKKIKKFSFDDFFTFSNEEKEIKFIQNPSIDKELINIFSEIIENKKNLEVLKLNGFHYNFDKIKNRYVKYMQINLEENDKDYKINNTYKKINLKLDNFPELQSFYIYVDILYEIDNFIKEPISTNLQRVFLFTSFIKCNITQLDIFLKKNNVELIVRNIEFFNKSKILAYISS